MKRRLSSVDMDLDTSVGSLSKKSRREKGSTASDEEEPASSPLTPSPLPPRSSPPSEEVKEVTAGVKEIELDQKSDVPLSDSSEFVEPSVTLDIRTSVETEEGVTAEEDVTPGQRPEEENAPEVDESQDPAESGSMDQNSAEQPTDDLKDAANASEDGVKPSAADPISPIKVPQSKSAVKEPVASENKPEAKA